MLAAGIRFHDLISIAGDISGSFYPLYIRVFCYELLLIFKVVSRYRLSYHAPNAQIIGIGFWSS